LLGTWRLGTLNVVIEADKLTLTHGGETKVWSRATCGEGFSFKFAQATADTIGFHPSAYKLHDFLDGPPISSLYAICDQRVYAFLGSPTAGFSRCATCTARICRSHLARDRKPRSTAVTPKPATAHRQHGRRSRQGGPVQRGLRPEHTPEPLKVPACSVTRTTSCR
jgi:hypothetical protein